MRKVYQLCMVAALLALLSCSEDESVAPELPRVAPAFTFIEPVTALLHNPELPLRLRWKATDEMAQAGLLHYKVEGTAEWKYLFEFPPKQREFDVDLDDQSSIRYRFALSTIDGKRWDSSAVVQYLVPVLTEPVGGDILDPGTTRYFRWTNFASTLEEVELSWSITGTNKWNLACFAAARDSAVAWPAMSIPLYSVVDFRIRGRGSKNASYVRGVVVRSGDVRFPKPGDSAYRLLNVAIDMQLGLPPGKDKTRTRYELSTDGGVTWKFIDREWFVLEEVTSSAFIRVSHPDVTYRLVSGPFSIVDRVQEYFQPRPGMEWHYDYKYSSIDYHGNRTTQNRWITISVLSEVRKPQRTEFPCSILVTEENGSQSTASGLLWQDTTIFRVVRGNFEPFIRAEIPGRHDASVDSLEYTFKLDPPPTLPLTWEKYISRRGKGVVYRSINNVESRQTGSSQEWRYRD
ncbi:MAG TPA: hypothetical protein PK916_08155 [Bacteroidota bacterium]|nr:hypothetical protein [Bacteroidota bacterium]